MFVGLLASALVTPGCGESAGHAPASSAAGGLGASGGTAGRVASSGQGPTNAAGGQPSPGSRAGGAAGTAGTSAPGGHDSGRGGGSAGEATARAGATSAGGSGGITSAAGSGGAATSAGGSGGAAAGSAGRRTDSPDVTVHLDRRQQTMEGFGVSDAFAESGFSDEQARQLFDPTTGLGLTILGIAMSSSGAATSSNTWSDVEKAKALGVNTFIAAAWTAAAPCKTNDEEDDGGHLEADCYASWAETVAAFPALVKDNTGVDLYGISPQHQPDFASCGFSKPCNGDFPSMLYTPDEFVEFVNLIGPKLHALNPPVKLLGPDTADWVHVWSNAVTHGATDPLMGSYDYGHALFDDPAAWAQLDVVATHQYFSQRAEPWPSDIPPTKPVFMTEAAGVKFWPEQGPSDDIQNGVAVAGWIHDAIVNGPASAWLYFWRIAQGTDDNEGLYLQSGSVTKRFYTLGNFSRFVRPGYVRVSITGDVPRDVLLTGYRGPDGTVVLVAVNQGTTDALLPVTLAGDTPPSTLTPHVTSATDDLAQKTPLAVSSGAFSAKLEALSVTTFVSGG
jgi:glucuronoarabinoxylan endo-1,4-beta-xylanase